MLLRPGNGRYVEMGVLDAGLTGHDDRETGADVVEVAELRFSKISRRPVRWLAFNDFRSKRSRTSKETDRD